MHYLFLIIAFILNSAANILLKVASQKGIEMNLFPVENFIFKNIYLFAGIFFFFLNACFYALALKSIPISYAYPIMVTSSLLLIGSFAFFYFGEQYTYYHAVGYAFIILGIVITSFGMK